MKPNFYSVLMNQKVDLKISYVLLLSQNMWSLWSISYNIKQLKISQFLAVETQVMSENIQCRLMDFRVYLFTIRGHPQWDSPQGQWHLCGSDHKLNIPQTWRTYCLWGRGWWVSRALLLGCRQSLKEYFSTAKTSDIDLLFIRSVPFLSLLLI